MTTTTTHPARTAVPTPRATRARQSWIPRTRRQKHNFFWGLVFTSPAIIGLVLFTLAPVTTSLFNSLTDVSLVGGRTSFVGLQNYRELLHDSSWWMSLTNTTILAVASVPLGLAVALGLALLLNLRARGMSIYRVIFFLPSIVPIVAAAVVWTYVLDPQYGILNNLLGSVGIQGPGWLSDPAWSKPALIIFGLWGVGNLMIILLAGLQGVPQELREQATIDGAGAWARFHAVTLPFISPHLLFGLVTGLIAGFQYFTQAFVLAGANGDPAGSTLVSGVYLYTTAFYNFELGYASAIGWVLFIIIAIASLMTFRLVGRHVYYGGAS